MKILVELNEVATFNRLFAEAYKRSDKPAYNFDPDHHYNYGYDPETNEVRYNEYGTGEGSYFDVSRINRMLAKLHKASTFHSKIAEKISSSNGTAIPQIIDQLNERILKYQQNDELTSDKQKAIKSLIEYLRKMEKVYDTEAEA